MTSGPLLVTGYPASWPIADARASLVVEWLEANDVQARRAQPWTGREAAPPVEHRLEIWIPASEAFQKTFFDAAGR